MSWPMNCAGFLLLTVAKCAFRPSAHIPSPTTRFAIGRILYTDDFANGLSGWTVESQKPGRVEADHGKLEIDVPAGCTVWLNRKFEGPIMIEYQATVISAGGPNDRVSDLNCFWMADDARSPGDLFATKRNGAFSDYDALRTYYVGLGGNNNTTTRFRRYIGEQGNRPLDSANDRKDPKDLLVANQIQTLRLVALDGLIQFYRDGLRVFEMNDPHPYRQGWFGLRTVDSHIQISHFRVYELKPNG